MIYKNSDDEKKKKVLNFREYVYFKNQNKKL